MRYRTGTGRRAWLLHVAAVACLWGMPAAAHTPYGQWKAYRQKHLTIGCHRDDPETYRIAKAIVAALDVELPEASARVARGPSAARLASLLGTGQMRMAVLSTADAVAMAAGTGTFEPYGAIALGQVLRVDDDRVLVATGDAPERHVRLVALALAGTPFPGLARALDVRAAPPDGLVRHRGIEAVLAD